MNFIIAFFAGIITVTLSEVLADWLEAIADRIMVENEERRSKLNDN